MWASREKRERLPAGYKNAKRLPLAALTHEEVEVYRKRAPHPPSHALRR